MGIELMQISRKCGQKTAGTIVDIQAGFAIGESKKETSKGPSFGLGGANLFGVLLYIEYK
jgi:hypothetical protein